MSETLSSEIITGKATATVDIPIEATNKAKLTIEKTKYRRIYVIFPIISPLAQIKLSRKTN
jgi:hypothetical protein